MKSLAGAVLIAAIIQLQPVRAQDLHLNDTTITSIATFSGDAVTVGPNVVIANTGDAVFKSRRLTVVPDFVIVRGGALQVISGSSTVNIREEATAIPSGLIMHQNVPNPFSDETQIRFVIARDSHVEINIYNILGQKIRSLKYTWNPIGFQSVRWDGKDNSGSVVSSGVYFYEIRAGDVSQVRMMSLIR